MGNSVGNWIILAGIVVVIIGFAVKTGLLSWFGNLPGDIHIKRDGFQFFLPVASMILISVVLSAVAAIIRRLF